MTGKDTTPTLKVLVSVLLCLVGLISGPGRVSAADQDGFSPLFNGRNLSGWVNVNCAPETWSVRDGMIHCTGKPTGALRTVRQYENFIFEVEWRHLSGGGNSGIFIWASPIAAPGVPFLRAVEVQVLDHGYNVSGKNEWYTTNGDVFPIHGSTMNPFGRHNGERSFPSEERSKGSPEWNHYRIECNGGTIRLSVNGKEVSGGENCSFRKGYLGLESEGAPIDFRNLRIKELPPRHVAPEMTAPLDQGWKTLFTGIDLRGWKQNAAVTSRWKAEGERILLKEGAQDPAGTLWTTQCFGNAEFVVDCRTTKPASGRETVVPAVELRGGNGQGIQIKLEGSTAGSYARFTITVRDREVTVMRGRTEIQRLTLPAEASPQGAFGLRDTGGPAEFMNVYARPIR